jgi:hypothetical protein
MSEWTNPAPLVIDGDAVNAQSVNQSTLVLSERTKILKALIDSIQAGEQLILRNVPVAEEALTGHVVYFDDNTTTHDLALAKWDELVDQTIHVEPADSAVYTGVVVGKPTTQLADILISGTAVLDTAARDRLFDGATPESGVYYLSNQEAGTVTSPKPAMSVRVLEYMSSGIVRVFPPSHEPITHTHLNYDLLTADWLAAGSFSSPPAGATYGYNFSSTHAQDINLAEAILPGVGEATFIGLTDGLHHFSSEIFKDEFGIWWTGGSAPAQDFELHALSADVKDMALLHTIRTDTAQSIQLVNSNGRVLINLTAYGTEDVEATGKAVVGIDFTNHKLQLADMVSKALAGAGVTVTSTGPDGTGDVTIASSLFNNYPIPAQVLNLNNAVTSIEGVHAITEFPIDRISQVACQCSIPELNDGTYTARIWIQVISPVANQVAPDVSYSLVPTPDSAGVTPGADTAIALPALPGSVSAGDVYYIETADIALTNSRGQLNYTLTLTNPSDVFKVLATGIKLIQQ